MTKELSMQICEKCEIPYEKVFHLPLSRDFITAYHLDFGQPKNFSKLFNLEYIIPDNEYGDQSASISFLILFNYAKGSNDYNTKGFLKLLLKTLDDFECAEYVKKAIREAKWVYE